MAVTKQQQLEWLASMWTASWVGSTVEYVDMSVLSIGVFCTDPIYPVHRITRQEWQQERDKMQKQQDNSWHERGDLPPVGCECECNVNGEWTGVYIIGAKRNGIFVMEDLKTEMMRYINKPYPNLFRPMSPLRTEREKAIDDLVEIICRDDDLSKDGVVAQTMARRIYDAGYRKEKTK